MRKALLFTILITCCAPPLAAQSSGEYNKYDVYLGYSHSRLDFGEYEGAHGVEAAVTGNVSRHVGLKFSYSFHRRSTDSTNLDLHNILVGVQFKDNTRGGNIKPFAHGLIGAALRRPDELFGCRPIFGTIECIPPGLNEPKTGLAGVIGGGLDIRIDDRVDFRAIQFDYNPARLGGETQHNLRLGLGLVFR